MGCEPGEGSKLNGRRGPLPHPPSESARREKSLWAEEALSKQRNAAWCPRDGGGEESGGGAAEAARLPASLLANPGETPPTPSRGCSGAGEEGGGCAQRLFSSSLLQTWVERERAPALLPRVAVAHALPSPTSPLSLWPGWGPSRPKCPKKRRALGAYPVAGRRVSREGRGRPALALSQPSGKGRRPGAELGNLNRSLSSPLPRSQDPASGPGCSHNG